MSKIATETPLYVMTLEYEQAIAELVPNIGIDQDYIDSEKYDGDYITDTLDALKSTIEVKAINVGKYIKRLEDWEQSLDTYIKELSNRKRVLKNRRERFKGYLKDCMEKIDIDKIESEYFVVRVVKNPPKVEITDEDALPDEFTETRTTEYIDKSLISKTLKRGESIPGACLTQTTRLEVKS